MSAGIDRILQEGRDLKQRRRAALEAVRALPPDARREVIAELIELEQEDEKVPAKRREVPQSSESSSTTKTLTYVDKAEAYVLAHPDGVTTGDVARAIGQKASAVDGSLRQLLKRGTIIRANNLWLPAPPKQEKVPEPKFTIRERVQQVFAGNGNSPLGAGELFSALLKLDSAINRGSYDNEMNRMRKEQLLVQVGVGSNNGGLYKLKEEPTPPP